MRIFVRPEERAANKNIDEQLKRCMCAMVPLDFEKEKLAISRVDVDGFTEKITIYELTLTKESHTNAFLKQFKRRLSAEQRATILAQRESRLDEQLCFYIRLDKDAFLDDTYVLTDSGNCVHIAMTLAAYPKTKAAALKVVESIFLSE